MVNIVICGPPRSGKSQLAKLLLRYQRLRNHVLIDNTADDVLERHAVRTRVDYDRDDSRYKLIQEEIARKTCSRENAIVTSNKHFINANSLIEPLVLLKTCLPNRGGHEELLSEDQVKETVQRYRCSLVILLDPISFPWDDGLCLVLSEDDWRNMKARYMSILVQNKIPFTTVDSNSFADCESITLTAVKGIIPVVDPSLFVLKSNSGENHPVNFSFFLDTPTKTNCIHIPTIVVNTEGYTQTWTSYEAGKTSRFIKKHGYCKLICLHFYIKVKSLKAQGLLLKGINVNGEQYAFLGCSASGLRDRKCYMLKGTDEEVEQIIKENGDFSQIRTVSKRLARIGLLFSAVTLTDVCIEPKMIKRTDDIERNGFNFTDGCGSISLALAKEIKETLCKNTGIAYPLNSSDVLGFNSLEKDYLPSVYQIRLQGFKGILALNPALTGRSIEVRPSMEKFETKEHPLLGICDISKHYTFGHLNLQFIQLLSGLGIEDHVFEEKFQQNYDALEHMNENSEMAVRVLQWHSQFAHAQCIIKYGSIERMPDRIQGEIKTKLKTIRQQEMSKLEKLRILVPESRNIFGVCDQIGVLEYGQCFVRVTKDGKPVNIRGQVVVCKNPCYLTSDIRVLKAVTDTENVNLRKLNHLVDCIVFPTKGKCPHAHETAGSDLDGDQFFVTWDKELIPLKRKPPYDYPAFEQKPENITKEKVYHYFSKQNEGHGIIARLNKLYNLWADRKGVSCLECETLGKLFSRGVDATKTGDEIKIPCSITKIGETESLRCSNENSAHSEFVWVKMKSEAKRRKEKFAKNEIQDNAIGKDIISEEFVEDLLTQNYGNISEFDKFELLWQWLQQTIPEDEMVDEVMAHQEYINFSLFTVEEKAEATRCGIPAKFLMNALNRSRILQDDELAHFSMDRCTNTWNFYFHRNYEDFKWADLFKALTENDNTLFLLRLENDVVVALQILAKLDECKEQPLEGGVVSSVFYSRHFGFKYHYMLGKEYSIDFNRNVLQLYRDGTKTKSFIWLKGADSRVLENVKSNKKNEQNHAVSVALQLFSTTIRQHNHPLITKSPFEEIEVFVRHVDTDCPYFDIYDGNDSLPVSDHDEEEVETDDDVELDFDDLFPKEIYKGDILSSEECSRLLSKVGPEGKPYFFDTVLQKTNWFTEEVVFVFDKLLETMSKYVVPITLPYELKELLTSALLKVQPLFNRVAPAVVLSISSSLHRLGLDSVNEYLVNSITRLTIEEFLNAIVRWELFYYLDYGVSTYFIEQLEMAFNHTIHEGQSEATTTTLYLFRMGKLHILHLLRQFEESKSLMLETGQPEVPRKKQASNSCLKFLKFDKTSEMENGIVTFHTSAHIDKSLRITKGQYVTVARQRDIRNKQCIIATCCIAQIQDICIAPCCVELKIIGGVPDVLHKMTKYEGIRHWQIDLIGNIITYERITAALKLLMEQRESSTILTLLSKTYTEETAGLVESRNYVNTSHNSTLNESQLRAVDVALSGKVTLIHGPPGTGKTSVACHLVARYLKSLNEPTDKILLVAETNVAVDNVVKRLRNEFRVVRIGPPEGVDREVYDVSLEGQMKAIEEREAKRVKLRDTQGNIHRNTTIMHRVLNSAQIVLSTCSGAGDKCLESYNFPLVIVDEATQTLETTLLCSVAHGVQKLVMIGDPQQLGPMVSAIDDTNINELLKTAFHRLYETKTTPICFLDKQYRMHEAIAAFPSKQFYNGELLTAECTAKRSTVIFPWPDLNTPFCFIDVQGKEQQCGTSFMNKEECQIVSWVVNTLLSVSQNKKEQRIGIEDIGVISLYRGQVNELKTSIQKGVKVSSVDGFQGQEKEVIVVSTVRSNDRGNLGFSDHRNRVNVLLTRAKRGLIIVGNKRTLGRSELWAKWLLQAPNLSTNELCVQRR